MWGAGVRGGREGGREGGKESWTYLDAAVARRHWVLLVLVKLVLLLGWVMPV